MATQLGTSAIYPNFGLRRNETRRGGHKSGGGAGSAREGLSSDRLDAPECARVRAARAARAARAEAASISLGPAGADAAVRSERAESRVFAAAGRGGWRWRQRRSPAHSRSISSLRSC